MVLDRSYNMARSFGQPGYRSNGSGFISELESLVDYLQSSLSEPLNDADYVVFELAGDYYGLYQSSKLQKRVNAKRLKKVVEERLEGFRTVKFVAGNISDDKTLRLRYKKLLSEEMHLRLESIVKQVSDLETFTKTKIDEQYNQTCSEKYQEFKETVYSQVNNVISEFWKQFSGLVDALLEQPIDNLEELQPKSQSQKISEIRYSDFLIQTQKVLNFGFVSKENPLPDIKRLVHDFKEFMYCGESLNLPQKNEDPHFYEGMRHALNGVCNDAKQLISKQDPTIDDYITLERYESYLELFISKKAIKEYLFREGYKPLKIGDVIGELRIHKNKLSKKLNYSMPTQNDPIGSINLF